MNYQEIVKKLESNGQTALLKHYDTLDNEGRAKLLSDIEAIDFSSIKNMIDNEYVYQNGELKPATVVSLADIEHRKKCIPLGEKALKEGKLGIVILSGGQGSRLGYSHAKGMYNIGINKVLSIFEIHIRQFVKYYEETKVKLHCFFMTSSSNNDEIIEFFKDNNYFGYDKDYVHFYLQGNNYPLNMDGKLLLSEKDTVCKAPNGNGLWYRDLINSECKNVIEKSGIEWLTVVSVDNVLQKFIDPVFMGAVIDSSAVCGAKVVNKVTVDEKIGTICLNNDRPAVIEYFEFSKYLINGESKYSAEAFPYGVTLNYIFNVEALNNIDTSKLPVHVANKKIAFVDEKGNKITPTENNVCKYEYLLTDLIEHMDSCIAFEIDREEEFAPVKNLTGADSVETARQALIKQGMDI